MIRFDGGDSELTIAEQAHVVGHANAVKSSLTVFENAAFWSEFLASGAETSGQNSKARSAISDWMTLPNFQPLIFRRGSGGGSASPDFYWQSGRYGFSTSRRSRWTSCSTERLVSAVNEHTRAGGLAIVATHLPLALERARTLELVSRRMAA